jgi:aspartate kinase
MIPDLGDFTTLGRGGSDTSGVALGVALKADKVDIFTDVDGVAKADPRVVPEAEFLEHIHYDTMLEMARYGAGVIHPRAVRTGRDGDTAIEVRSTFNNNPGTIINRDPDESSPVGIATLGPLESLVLEHDILGLEVRATWEQDRLIMSLVDEAHGALILGASPEKAQELATVKEELKASIRRIDTNQSWVSLIGSTDSRLGSEGTHLLEKNGIEVSYQEQSDRRQTYIIPSIKENHAVKVLYDAFLK